MRNLHFAPIQGATAAECLEPPLRENLATVIYQRPTGDGTVEILLRSEAALCALIDTRSRWRWLAYPARWVPTSWRDGVYNWVARNRHRFFPKNACPLPDASKSQDGTKPSQLLP